MGRRVGTPKNELPHGVAEAVIRNGEIRARNESAQLAGAREVFARRERKTLEDFINANPGCFVGVSAIGEMAAFRWSNEQYLNQELTVLWASYEWPEKGLSRRADFLQGGGFNELALLDYGVEVRMASIQYDGSARSENAQCLLATVGESLYLSDAGCVITEHSITVGYTPYSSTADEEAFGDADPGMYVKRANIGGSRYLFAPFEVWPKG